MFSGCPRLLALAWALTAAAVAAAPERVLRVAADPNNLPFSNDRGEGFENRLAELIARELGARLEYMWWPQRRGFFRETLGSGRADVVMGVPAGFERVLTTRPYYRSSYVFVQRPGPDPVHSFDDARLRDWLIGVQLAGDDGANPPPAHVLARRGLVANLRGFTLYGDYGQPNPPAEIIRAVADGRVHVAVAWGPMAGYFAARQAEPLLVVPADPCDCALPMSFAIAVGVRRGADDLRDEIDVVLERRRDEVRQLLVEYGVPLLEETEHARAP